MKVIDWISNNTLRVFDTKIIRFKKIRGPPFCIRFSLN